MRGSARTHEIEAALTELPIFPLPQVVLFPRATLHLYVFEPRYRALLHDCLATHKALAMARIADPSDGSIPGHPPICAVAGAGVIVEHQLLSDGRATVLLRGCARVRLDELPFVPPYRRARATVLRDEQDVHGPVTPSDRAALLASAAAFVTDVRRYNPGFALHIPAELDADALSDYYAHHLVIDTHVRQALLEELCPKERVRIVTRELATQHSELSRESGGLLH